MGCLIVFQSMTHAQRTASILRNQNIRVNIIRPPLETGRGSCSAALRISEHQLNKAQALISKLSVRPIAYYRLLPDGKLQEVFP